MKNNLHLSFFNLGNLYFKITAHYPLLSNVLDYSGENTRPRPPQNPCCLIQFNAGSQAHRDILLIWVLSLAHNHQASFYSVCFNRNSWYLDRKWERIPQEYVESANFPTSLASEICIKQWLCSNSSYLSYTEDHLC